MTLPSLPLVHQGIRALYRANGFNLIVPGDPLYDAARTASVGTYAGILRIAGSPLSSEAEESAARRVSFSVPGAQVSGALRLVPYVGGELASFAGFIGSARPTAIIAPDVWADRSLCVRVLAHEGGHCLDLDRQAHAEGDVSAALATAMWCLSYIAVPWFRGWTEACQKTLDVQARVIVDGESVDDVVASEIDAMRSAYALADDAAMATVERVLRACGASLKAGKLHGRNTMLHAMLRTMLAAGADFGAWNEEIVRLTTWT